MSGPGVSRQLPLEVYRVSVVTTNATPATLFALPLLAGQTVGVLCEGVCADTGVAHRAEFRARNQFSRTTVGVSARDGTVNGVQDSVANTFGGPRPSLTFGDPSVSNVATVLVTGKLATTITWSMAIIVTRAQG
jgi:hypothetical protein